MSKITYTFSVYCPIAVLAGKTFTGGVFARADNKWQGEPDAVRFAESIDGKAVMARIAGKPELEAALAAHKAAERAIKDRLATLGWPQYKAVQRAAINARDAYDQASERGYPAREAAAMRLSDDALEAAARQYPDAALYAMAEAYSMAAHYAKAAAGSRAMRAIEQGSEPAQAVAEMDAEWSVAASKAVQNA